jgi:phytoene/squalene synthetase
MKQLYDKVSSKSSKYITHVYSTSFSLGIHFLGRKYHQSIYNIYGFVRLADEIVDSFQDYNQMELFNRFKLDLNDALEKKISLNPVLNAFQRTVHEYQIDDDLITAFMQSMEMDLHQNVHDENSYKQYILGSAEVVGLMCLKVFTDGNEQAYQKLKPSAMKLGSAFQKVNFLRDLKQDFSILGRTYFPGIDFTQFDAEQKKIIEDDIEKDFDDALQGIRQLPRTSKLGVFIAYVYYKALNEKIRAHTHETLLHSRIRVHNFHKFILLIQSWFRFKFNII